MYVPDPEELNIERALIRGEEIETLTTNIDRITTFDMNDFLEPDTTILSRPYNPSPFVINGDLNVRNNEKTLTLSGINWIKIKANTMQFEIDARLAAERFDVIEINGVRYRKER